MISNWLLSSVVAVAAVLPMLAHARDHCVAKVLQAELLPFAPQGSWLTTAKIEVRAAGAPGLIMTLHEALPWQMVVRQGEVFSIPCEDASQDSLRLASLATAPSYRSSRRSRYVHIR